MKIEKPQNILLIMPYGSVGGMERLAETFYDNYRKMGHTVKAVKIVGLGNDIIDFGQDEVVLSKKDFAAFSVLGRLFFYLQIPILLRRIIRKHKIDTSIAFGDMANCFSAITKTKERKVASFHSMKSIEFVNTSGISGFFKWSIQNTYKRFDKVVAISKTVKIDLIDKCKYKFKNLQTIYNPHDKDGILEKSKEAFSDDDERLVQKDFILFLGRLGIVKAPWHLIKAFALIANAFPEINLIMIGDGDAKVEKFTRDLVSHLNLLDRVLFAGRKNNPYKYLSKAKCLALSSFYEGTPNVIVEAMTLNIPIITTNCTDGILEMMVDEVKEEQGGFLITETGLITPNILAGNDNAIPTDFEFTPEDKKYAEGLKLILNPEMNNSFRNTDKRKLLEKYDIKNVLNEYLN